MNIEELYDLTLWINDKVIIENVIQKYQNLLSILSQNNQSNQPKKPFENQKLDLINTIKVITFDTLTKQQIDCLECLKITPYIGEIGVDLVEDILYKNVIDIATSIKKFQEIVNNLNTAKQVSDNLKQNLKGILVEDEEKNSNDVLIRISFKNEAYIKSFSDLKKWSNIWYEIIYGITLASGSTVDDIKIIGASKGSLIFELLVIITVAKVISKVLLEALKVVDRMLDIKKKTEEIKALKLSNNKIAKELEDEIEKEKLNGTEGIKEILLEYLKLNKESANGDKVSALSKSINNLIDFLEKGGEIDFVILSANDNKEETEDLRLSNIEIKRLESKILLIEYKK